MNRRTAFVLAVLIAFAAVFLAAGTVNADGPAQTFGKEWCRNC